MLSRRLFVAFPVSQEAEKETRFVQDKMRDFNPHARVKWVGDEGFHVTVAFLGEIDENMIENIKKILEKILKKYSKFDFYLDKVDAFPNQRDAKVIVIKVGESDKDSLNIHNDLIVGLKKINLKIENRNWHPHLTLGRNKFNNKIIGFDQIQIKNTKPCTVRTGRTGTGVEWQVDRIELIESELLPSGPKYTVLENFSLQ